MSKTKSLTVSIRVKWWVQPYMFALRLAAPLIALALGRNGVRVDAFCDRHADFIVRHGVKAIAA